jgi:hypothetical protein
MYVVFSMPVSLVVKCAKARRTEGSLSKEALDRNRPQDEAVTEKGII